MGKTTGFLEYERVVPESRSPLVRIKDWKEFHEHMPEKALQEQGARCMDCGVPFCHTGTILAGGASGCPINNLIPEWNDLVFRGQWKAIHLPVNLLFGPSNCSTMVSQDMGDRPTSLLLRPGGSLLKHAPTAAQIEAVEAAGTADEVARVGGRAVHLLLGDNYHEAKLTNAAIEKHLGVATNRNLTVIRALADKWCR